MSSNPLKSARRKAALKAKANLKTKAAPSETKVFSKLVKSKNTTNSSKEYGNKVKESFFKSGKPVSSISKYEFVSEIGEGAQGAVFLAHQISEHGIKKRIAIKVLKEHYDEKAIQRLVNEAKLLERLTQGAVVEMLALESFSKTAGGKKNYFLVEELIDGQSLQKFLALHSKKNLLMNPAVLGFTLNRAALALDEAHNLTDAKGKNLNLIHRSLSPSNILFNEKAGIIKLSDFGMASVEDASLTSNKLKGKPNYMAPEQFAGKSTPACDIWALGVIGYEALTGFLPYKLKGKNNVEIINNFHLQSQYYLRTPAEVLNVPEGHYDFDRLSDIIMKCLNYEASKRPSADELQHLLAAHYLYAEGFGPTSQTVAAYIDLIKEMPVDQSIVVSDIKLDDDTNKTLGRTLYIKKPITAIRYRHKKYYNADFIKAIEKKEANPCLLPKNGSVYSG